MLTQREKLIITKRYKRVTKNDLMAQLTKFPEKIPVLEPIKISLYCWLAFDNFLPIAVELA